MLAIATTGFLLGWSIAWPPGPVNAEMVRRGLTRGFWPALAVGLGACSSDFLWALGVALLAGQVARNPAVELALGCVSVLLLAFLAWTFLRGGWRAWRAHRRGEALAEPARLQGVGGGWLLGFTLALSSPWNLAFWLGVLGQQGTAGDLASSLALATGVVTGAAAWGVVLCAALQLGARFATPLWHATTQTLTGLLMVGFAVRAAVQIAQA